MSARKVARKAPTSDKAPPSGKVVSLHSAAPRPALGPGAHFARLLGKVGEARYQAQVIGGERVEIGIAPEVDPELADQCLAEQSIVLVGMLGKDIALFGALQTRAKQPEEVVIDAPRRLTLRAGKSKLTLTADGKIRLSGNEITVDCPREVRLLSARVEIP